MRSRSVLAALLVALAACESSDEGSPAPAECETGQIECSADALELHACESGAWKTTACMRDQGKLCEAGACVEPWRYGSPSFDQCASEPLAAPGTLREKAEYFDAIARRLHIHPELGWLSDVVLATGAEESTATWQDVETWDSGENDGLWSALYLSAQAYRYAVTGDAETLQTIQLLLTSEQRRMRITGVPGIFTRQLIPPNLPGIACPSDLAAYVPDVEKDDNQWVRVGDDGCLQYVDGATMAWTSSSVCGLSDLAGWCFKDNVSEDEYAGHMFGLGAVAKLVDEPNIQALTRDLLRQVGDHLIDNQLTFVDWDGRVTEHGRIWAGLIIAGYNAAMSLSFIKTIALATGDAKYAEFYADCLLKRSGESDCIQHSGATPKPYDDVLEPTGLNLGCKSNWNNYSMYMLSLHGLLWGERDPEVRAKVQAVMDREAWLPPGDPRPLSEQNNAFFDFIYAAGKALGPGSNGRAFDAVRNGICMLRQFPATKIQKALECAPEKCVEVCKDRFDEPMTDYPRPVAERCSRRFLWWASPYTADGCTANDRFVHGPADYLVAYWMGRYYGFIDPES